MLSAGKACKVGLEAWSFDRTFCKVSYRSRSDCSCTTMLMPLWQKWTTPGKVGSHAVSAAAASFNAGGPPIL
eukprot:8419398-Prorocentrum_lima.AAC.1